MIERIAGFSKRPFIRNIATVATGAFAAQVVVVAFSPIITRLYGPEAFGVLGVFMSITGILGSVTALTYSVAIVLPAEDREAKDIIVLSLGVIVCMTMLTSFVFIFFKKPIIHILQIQAIAAFAFIIPAYLFFSACNGVLRQWMLRKKQFRSTATIDVASAFTLNAFKTGAGFFLPSAVALVAISLFGSLLNMLMLIVGARKTLFAGAGCQLLKRLPTWKRLLSLAKQYRDFPMYRAPTVLFGSISLGIPVLLLAGFFGPASAGFYALGNRVIALPSQIIGKAVGDVLYPRLAQAMNTGENVRRLIIRAMTGKFFAGVIPFGLIMLAGPWLFGFVFGNEWRVAGEYGRWLSLWSFFKFLSQPCVLAAPVLRVQGPYLIFQVVVDVLRISSIYLGYIFFKNAVGTISLFCIIGALSNIFIILFIIKKASGYHTEI